MMSIPVFPEVKFKVESRTVLPLNKATPGSIGYDIHSFENREIKPGETAKISTGIWLAYLSDGWYISITGRSSLNAINIDVKTGTIDPDYRGPIKVLIRNNTNSNCIIEKDNRIAQLIFVRACNNMKQGYELLYSNDKSIVELEQDYHKHTDGKYNANCQACNKVSNQVIAISPALNLSTHYLHPVGEYDQNCSACLCEANQANQENSMKIINNTRTQKGFGSTGGLPSMFNEVQ